MIAQHRVKMIDGIIYVNVYGGKAMRRKMQALYKNGVRNTFAHAE